ncbi:hypothetical protein C0993_000132 [Termitomyces sp. T159_Od127]|nr:hypothetical protein C0993_000132 [Termitomyces sp. T159_Od127]
MSVRKRRKIDVGTPTEKCFEDIVAEIDLEIALRRRVAETDLLGSDTPKLVKERSITMECSKDFLLKKLQSQGNSGSTISFKDVALDVVSTIEAPLDIIFERELTHDVQSAPVHTARPPRPPPRNKLPRNPNGKFLYIRSSDLNFPYDENYVQTYLLRCPECLRQSFTSLQGLLNHARISHGTEWGTHDECVRACAVVDPDLDVEMGIEVGLGPNGILPGIRSLFQMAVGVHQASELMLGGDVKTVDTGSRPESNSQSLNLTKTLGLHEDTPALAPFLGKQAIRRSIKILGDENDLVDIEGFDDDGHSQNRAELSSVPEVASSHLRRPWRMHYVHRSDFEPEMEKGTIQDMSANDNLPISRETSEGDKPNEMFEGSQNSLVGTTSIFGFHQRLTVFSLSSPDDAPLTTTRPPFVVVGHADEPFLAKIELCFSGAFNSDGELTDQTVCLEHWVELDLSKISTPVVGDEQMVDIELDRGTVLLPLQKGYPPIGSKAQWSQMSSETNRDDNQAVPQQDHTDILKNLAKKFPMTLKEAKSSRQDQPQVPYRLVSTSQFESFIPGRKKAIEWGRARAIQTAYTQQTQGQLKTQGLIPLTTADVYCWLSEEGHFIRPPDATKPKIENLDIQIKSNLNSHDVWCITCGQRIEAHTISSAVKTKLALPFTSARVKDSPEVVGKPENLPHVPLPCNILPRVLKMPMVNVFSRLRMDLNTAIPEHGPNLHMKALQVVHLGAACDPRFIMTVHDIVSALKLPSFAVNTGNSERLGVERFGKTQAAIERHFAPHVILALAARCFVRSLVVGGVNSVKTQLSYEGSAKKGQGIPEEMAFNTVLTPSHILTGVLTRRDASSPQNYPLCTAIFECLSRLGVPATPATLTTDPT